VGQIPSAVPESAVVYEDAELLEQDGLGYTCRIGNERVFVGKYVPLAGTTIHAQGDRGRLCLPRWFVEQQALPLERPLSDAEVERWYTDAALRVATAKDAVERAPDDAAAHAALDRATTELSAAMAIRARRLGAPRR
jgi:hypothetical protein